MERNIYLAETHKGIKHSYSYDMQTGKYYLESGGSNKQLIQKIGKFPSKFKSNGSGTWNTKKRLDFVKENPQNQVYRHYVPDFNYNKLKAFYTPITKKFSGYAQRPRSFKNDQLPQHLRTQSPLIRKDKYSSPLKIHKKSTIQLGRSQPQSSVTQPLQNFGVQIPFFRSSVISMINSRPNIRKAKKSCYHNRCQDINYKQTQYQAIVQQLNNSLKDIRQTAKLSDFATTKSFTSKTNLNFSTGF